MIKFATIGTSVITTKWIESAESTKLWKLSAVYSRSAESAKTFAAKYNVIKTHTEVQQLCSDPEIEAIYIASPNNLHFEHATAALSAGKHVILEKPACSTSKELDALFQLAKEKSVFLIEAFRHIHEVNFKVLKEQVKKLGSIYGASLNYAQYSSRFRNVLAGEEPNIFSLKFSGGSMPDLGVYAVSAAVALFGAPVAQTYKPFIIRTGVDGGGFILLDYGTFGVSINSSKIWASTAPSEIYSEVGTLRMNGVNDISKVELWDASTKETTQLAKPVAELNMSEEAEAYAKIISSNDKHAAAELEEISKATQKVTEALRKENGIIYPADE